MQTSAKRSKSKRVKGKSAMVVIRPVEYDDLDGIIHLAESAGMGLTTLPKNPTLLEKRISDSQHSFSEPSHNNREKLFLFVIPSCKNPIALKYYYS